MVKTWTSYKPTYIDRGDMEMFEQVLKNVEEKNPLVHNVTNYVTVNDCANIVLACGGSPIMADDSDEVCDITSICNSLVINIGTLNARTIRSRRRATGQTNFHIPSS